MTEKDNIITKPNKYHNGKIYTIRCKEKKQLKGENNEKSTNELIINASTTTKNKDI